jgi:hypothetical protein
MRKRKVDEYFECYGIPGVSDSAIRKVVSRLKKQKEYSHAHSFKERFQHLDGALLREEKNGIYTLNLQFYIDTLCQKSTNFTDLLRRTVLKDHANQEAIPGCLYADEAVVGNVLAPDNRRRSWCFYFCWMSILPMRKDTLWLPISVIRSDIIEQLPGGLPQALSIVMRQCQQFLSDGIIVDGQIVITHPLHLLADEDGLKKMGSHKGASGLRPCIRCANCISKGNEVDGFYSIGHEPFDDFEQASDDFMKATMEYLQNLSLTSTASRLQEAEKLSGWKWEPEVFAMDAALWQVLRPSRFIYDAMHCLWNNGIACLELGLFWQAASANGVQRADLQTFLDASWEPSMQIGSTGNLKSLAHPKLLKTDGSDFRGDADQTLQLMVLMTFFAQQLLSDVDALKDNIASLVALNNVCVNILNAKIHPHDAAGLVQLQEQHLRLFKICYSEDWV